MKIKIPFLAIILSCFTVANAQKGYVKMSNDSMLSGFIRASIHNGQSVIEVWRTKNVKDKRIIAKTQIVEYAIKKDTFKVLHGFMPFPQRDSKYEEYYDIIDAKVLSRGKVTLLQIFETRRTNTFSTTPVTITAGAILNSFPTYLLEDDIVGNIQALSRNNAEFHQVLIDFLTDEYVNRHEEVNGKLKYRDIPALIKQYNLNSQIN